MINKLHLISAINKYYLGENESVKWSISNNTLTIAFMSQNKEVIGKITYPNFTLEDSDLAIFDTKKLLNLIAITSGDLLFNLEKTRNTYTKLHFADNTFNLTYALADPLLIGKVANVNEPEWNATIPLEKEHVDNMVKAKSALPGISSMLVSTTTDMYDKPMCIFTFGDENGHNNKITYQMYGDIEVSDVIVPFNSDTFKNILHQNKDLSTGTMYLNYSGLMKLEFTSEDGISSQYYLIRREQDAF